MDDHEEWLRLHHRRAVERERWTAHDWQEAAFLADLAWDERGLYLYAAEHGIRQQQYRRAGAELDRRARFDTGWMLDVMGL